MANIEPTRRRILPALILATLLTGCAVGPDFKSPAAPAVAGYTSSPASEDSLRFVKGSLVNPQWWQGLGSARLNGLIDEALLASPTLAAAQATLRQAQEVHGARAGSTLYPQADANLSSQRQQTNPSALGQTGDAREFTLYNVGAGVRYTLDLAGGNRRALEALAARVDYQRYQLEGARLTLAANIVTTAITQGGLTMQIKVTEDILLSQEEQMELARERVRLGQASPDEVLTLETQVEQTRATIPLLRNRFQQSEHLLAVLAGRAPATGALSSFSLEEFTLPADLPLVVPSELVRARPDIQAAESLLHAANAEYGVAIARLYPQLNLSANLGSQALTTGALFGSGSAVWSLVGQLTQPLFNPGLPAEKRAALAAFDAAAANYRNVVLESLRNVADLLSALDNDTQRLAALTAAHGASKKSLSSMERRYALGAVSYLEQLIAQQQSQQTRINLIEAQTQHLVDSAAFYQAMGGGGLNNSETIAKQ
ncbi:MAG: efflux transporter outer membrane subunit [Proteobacteria bacterium]|nr:efflux transporter outer membrane subunit [Desulfocapsa sp.]MBU3945680.1 efflux transporter outer membrane subunit [Pseudomonadota bacterium]MCG2744316.1 efflux transporter outer membrane subunit [Desulfobacteraceae bacterium]MBU3982434.1 efflux transporter outer membrane subunit [Pseudomonadota bacterium]MBU4029574.1 efflux transporter outer membrane subunit [Pseudomonadota bacterium]